MALSALRRPDGRHRTSHRSPTGGREGAGCRKRSVLRHAHSTCVSVSKAIAFHLILSCRLHLSEPISAAIAHATAPSYSPPTPTGFSGNLYYRHKGASGSLLTALSKLTRRSASPLTPTLRRRVSPDSVLTSYRTNRRRMAEQVASTGCRRSQWR